MLSAVVTYAGEFNDFSVIGKLDLEAYPIVYKEAQISRDHTYLKMFNRYLDGAIDGIITAYSDECKTGVTSEDIRSMLFAMDNDGYGKKMNLRTAIFFAVVQKCDINLNDKIK